MMYNNVHPPFVFHIFHPQWLILGEMKVFTHQNMIPEDDIKFGWILFLLLLFINLVIGEALALTTRFEAGLAVGFGLFIFEYGFLCKYSFSDVLLLAILLEPFCWDCALIAIVVKARPHCLNICALK